MLFSPTDSKEMRQVIESLSNSSKPDFFGISNKLLRTVSSYVCEPIGHIPNLSMTNRVFPEIIKSAIVIPIHKKGDPSEISKYRPISLLLLTSSVITKVLERIIFRRFSPFLFGIHPSDSSISPHQYGFRSKFSTAHALIDATQFMRSQLYLKNAVLGQFLAFSKNFDMADHGVLLSKLNKFGIRGVPFSWFGSYLSGRVQSVSLGGVTSHPLPVQRGVPQGSVLVQYFSPLY